MVVFATVAVEENHGFALGVSLDLIDDIHAVDVEKTEIGGVAVGGQWAVERIVRLRADQNISVPKAA